MDRKVGFTGTRLGMSEKQKYGLRRWLYLLDPTEFHHGDCVGADAEADQIARKAGILVALHPPTNQRYRANCFQEGDKIYPEAEYLDRNHEIVDECPILIAAPKSLTEELRSGTWATVRYAHMQGRNVIVLAR